MLQKPGHGDPKNPWTREHYDTIAEYIKTEKRSEEKWLQKNKRFIDGDREYRNRMYGPKKPHAFKGKTSEPDQYRYIGYGIAPPGSKKQLETEMARGGFSGNFEKSHHAEYVPSKFGKPDYKKKWYDYSGAKILKYQHKDPVQNSFTRYRTTPRGLQKPIEELMHIPDDVSETESVKTNQFIDQPLPGHLERQILDHRFPKTNYRYAPLTKKVPIETGPPASQASARSHVSRSPSIKSAHSSTRSKSSAHSKKKAGSRRLQQLQKRYHKDRELPQVLKKDGRWVVVRSKK